MTKAGGIISIIAGIFGVMAGFFTLFFGGLSSAFSVAGSGMVVGMGWGGIAFSMLVIVYGAVALYKPAAGGTGLVLSSLSGIVLGGTLVAIVMVLSLIGGFLVLAGRKKVALASTSKTGVILAALVPLMFAGYLGLSIFGKPATQSIAEKAQTTNTLLKIGDVAHSGKFDVALLNVGFSKSIGESMGESAAEPGSVFAILKVRVKCVDSESRLYGEGDLYGQIDGKNLKFDTSETILGLDSPVGMINPMTEKTGYIVYKIPENTPIASLTWQPSPDNDEQRFSLAKPEPESKPLPVSSPAVAEAPADTHQDPQQVVKNSVTYKGPNGSVLSLNPDPTGFYFSLNVVSAPDSNGNANTGEAEGELASNNGVAIWKSETYDCSITFTIAGNSVSLAQNGDCGFGLGVSVDGKYVKE